MREQSRDAGATAAGERSGILLVLGAALLWSTGGVAIKALADGPLKVACYRSAVAAVVLFLHFRPRGWRWTPAFVVAVVSYAGCLTTFVVATKWTTAANAIFLQYSGVVWVLLLSPLLLKEPFHKRDAAAVAAALCGMALFFVGKFEAGGRGLLMGVLTSLFFAALVLALRLQRGRAAEATVTWGNVLAAAALFPFVRHDLALSPRSGAVLVFLGVVQIAGAYALFVEGLKHVTATQASLAGMLEPIANPIWVFLVLGERPSGWAIAGGVIVLAAIGWRTLSSPSMPDVAPPD
jgi:drug/metabolite transporter, DME family